MSVWRALAIIALIFVDGAQAQTPRERAVAIDAVPIPPIDDGTLEPVASGLRFPWSLAFLPNGDMLVVEKHHGVRVISATGELGPLLQGAPTNVLREEDSGYLDIVLDPQFSQNRLVYLAFAQGDVAANRTAIWRARFDGERFSGGRVIFRVNVAKQGPSHPGGRLLFLPDDTLLLSVGDGYTYCTAAQDLRSHLGKVLRLTREGAPAPDNPFIGRADVAPEIWTLGHRNIQGLTRDSETGEIWAHEHGPRGGDEINLLQAGRNYGWPAVSNGIDYDGTLISERMSAPEYERPRFFWAPSIAPSGLAIYRGDRYPDFVGKAFVGGLASRALSRLRIGRDTGLFVEETRMFAGLRARIRDVRIGPDGLIYFLTDDAENARLFRLAGADAPPAPASGRATSDLNFWIGDWEGASSFLPAFTPDAVARAETMRATCAAALTGAYIQCDVRLARTDGRERGVMWLWNFNEVRGQYELMTLASNHGQSSTVQMAWDPVERAYVGHQSARTADDRAAVERLIFRPSPDGALIQGFEQIRPNDNISGGWIQTFEFTLRKS